MTPRPATPPPAEREALDAEVLRAIADAYEAYRSAPRALRRREPCLTVTYLRDYLAQCGGMPEAFRFATQRRQTALVRASLARLRRAGLVTYSLGLSPLTGREAQCWEPVGGEP